ncbi:MAG TPA: response regulator [Pyrinomonadaceae bacterium]
MSYACDRRGFSIIERAPYYQNIMLMDIDPCRPLRIPWRAVVIQPAILYVESNLLLAQLVTDLLDLARFHVWRADDGWTAQMFLRHEQRFALLLIDNELRDTSGLAVVTYARTLAHRESLPIILFSIEDCEQEAKAAGANEFLRKPHDLYLLLDMIRRLIGAGVEKR